MNAHVFRGHVALALAVVLLLATRLERARSNLTAEKDVTQQTLFATPEEAVQALVAASKAKDRAALGAIFGPDYDKLLSGDDVQDDNELAAFVAAVEHASHLEKADEATFTLNIGEQNWPFPIPIVKAQNQWRFDTAAGMEESLNRRIGENELSAIAVSRAYVLAQWEYYTEATDTLQDGLAVYAQKFMSTPGKRDGLYWDTTEDAEPSPLGALVAQARAEGYAAGIEGGNDAPTQSAGSGSSAHPADRSDDAAQPPRAPYQGYYFKILKAQGAHAPGGRLSYVINGNMIAGYALMAYPAKWGSSGVMTFIVNQQGRVYQKNLGEKTAQLAAAITEFDPDPSWELVQEE